jgi:hypothetical protein
LECKNVFDVLTEFFWKVPGAPLFYIAIDMPLGQEAGCFKMARLKGK